MLARLAFVGALSLVATAPAAHSAQVLKLDLASPENAKPRGVAVQSAPLRARTNYVVSVSGTGSLWTPDASVPVNCGAPETGAITEPTPGRAVTPPTVDAAIVFAAPRGVPFLGGFACLGSKPPMPPAVSALRMGNNGLLRAVTPIGGQPKAAVAGHTYHYAVAGRGRSLQLQYADPLVYDNSGVLTVTIRTRSECRAVKCTTMTAATPTPTPTPTPAASAPTTFSVGSSASLPCVFGSLPARDGQPAAYGLCG